MCFPLRQLDVPIQTVSLGDIIPIYKSNHVPLNTSYTNMFNICPNLYTNFQESIQCRKQGIQAEKGQRQESVTETGTNNPCLPSPLSPSQFMQQKCIEHPLYYGITGEKMSNSSTLFSGTS